MFCTTVVNDGSISILNEKSTGKIIRVHKKSDLTIKGKANSDIDKFLVNGAEKESVNSEILCGEGYTVQDLWIFKVNEPLS